MIHADRLSEKASGYYQPDKNMNDKINFKDRDSALKLIAIAVIILELFILGCTLIYQMDEKNHVETPITEEMAKLYIDHPEKLKSNERISASTLNSMYNNQKVYLLISDATVHHTFPWKGWILIAIGAPIGLFFLISLITKAYFQTIEPDFKEDENNSSQWIVALNRLSKINVTWFMLLLIAVLFLFWYIPELIKFAGNVTSTWLAKFWWIPVSLMAAFFLIIIYWLYLQYKIKLKVMHMEMEKFKMLHYEEKQALLLSDGKNNPVQLIEQTIIGEDNNPTEAI